MGGETCDVLDINLLECTEDHIEMTAEPEYVDESLIAINEGRRVLEVKRWGKWSKGICDVSWVLRFITTAKSPKSQHKTGDLNFDELRLTKKKLFGIVQSQAYPLELAALKQSKQISKASSITRLSPFIGKDGLLRVQGRLELSAMSYDEKHPIILPNSHLSLLIIRSQHNRLKHAGVTTMITALRDCYWIVGLRRLAKRVKRECVPCQKQDTKASCQSMKIGRAHV